MAEREFYIGYAPKAPPGSARFVRAVVAVIFVLVAAVALLAAASQRAPSDAVWRTSVSVLEGEFRAAPHPMLLTREGERTRTVLLVNPFKCGALRPAGACGPAAAASLTAGDDAAARSAALASLDGKIVRAAGLELERDGRLMLELLAPNGSSIDIVGDAPSRAVATSLERAAVRGEIVDAKCFLGAMKPGEGKTHRLCAVRCIAGGVPPMLAMLDAAGRQKTALLIGPDGAPLGSELLPLVGDLVEGEAGRAMLGDLEILTVDPRSLRRR